MHFNLKSKGDSYARTRYARVFVGSGGGLHRIDSTRGPYTDAKSYKAQFTKRYAPNGDRERARRLANQARKIVAA